MKIEPGEGTSHVRLYGIVTRIEENERNKKKQIKKDEFTDGTCTKNLFQFEHGVDLKKPCCL